MERGGRKEHHLVMEELGQDAEPIPMAQPPLA